MLAYPHFLADQALVDTCTRRDVTLQLFSVFAIMRVLVGLRVLFFLLRSMLKAADHTFLYEVVGCLEGQSSPRRQQMSVANWTCYVLSSFQSLPLLNVSANAIHEINWLFPFRSSHGHQLVD